MLCDTASNHGVSAESVETVVHKWKLKNSIRLKFQIVLCLAKSLYQ
jgi:hypothetical protein